MSDLMKFSIPEISEAVKSLGYKAKAIIEDDFALIESAANGRSFVLYPLVGENNFVPNVEVEALLVRFRAAWYQLDELDESQADALCNWFNTHQPFTKLYRKTYKTSYDLVLEADLYVLDGMSVAAFQNRLQAFISSYEYAMKCLERCSFQDKAEILDRHNKAIEMLHGECDDPSEAVHLYRVNSHIGYAGSQNNFGDLFETGELVEKDELLAMYWYTRASERGEPTAYFSLASMLEKSRDNPDSMVLAAQYAILASEQLPEGKNKTAAIEIKVALKEILSPELYELAKSYAENFRPIYEEKWTLSDAPGPKVNVVAGTGTLN